jgi:hypothetical protein
MRWWELLEAFYIFLLLQAVFDAIIDHAYPRPVKPTAA